MAAPSWSISGQYFETCSCDFVCPCILELRCRAHNAYEASLFFGGEGDGAMAHPTT